MKVKSLSQSPELFAPLFLLATLTLALPNAPEWLLILLPTFFLASTQEKVWLPLSLFTTFSLVHHLWIGEHHLWNFGLELSFLTSLFLASLGFQGQKESLSLFERDLKHFEEERERLSLTLAQEQEGRREEIHTLKQHLSSLEGKLQIKEEELSSLATLNEILRSGHAKSLSEKLKSEKEAADKEHQLTSLQEQCRRLEGDLQRLTHTEGVASQNRELFQELNQARLEKAQTQEINETLARLHAQSLLQAKEASQKKGELEEQLQQTQEHFEVQLGARDKEIQELSERLAKAREQVHEFAKIEPLFRQLKQQFEEKNQILHETRKELFHKQTELERLEIELKEREGEPIPSKLLEELAELEASLTSLEEENRLLLELVQKWGKEGAEASPKAPKKKKKSPIQPELLSF